MTIRDIGPRPQSFDLETETIENTNYRTVAWSGKYPVSYTHLTLPTNREV